VLGAFGDETNSKKHIVAGLLSPPPKQKFWGVGGVSRWGVLR